MQRANELRKERKVEGMNIEVGQWYRCRDENAIGNVLGVVIGEKLFVVVWYKHGRCIRVCTCCENGRYSMLTETELDLLYHLPDCTGPDWKPQKWRPVSVEDLRDGMKRARFRNFSTAVWMESHLRGARWKGTTLEWHDLVEDRFWIYCEVLDD